MGKGKGVGNFWGRDTREKREDRPKRVSFSSTKLKPSWEAHTLGKGIQIGPKAPSLGPLG